MSQVELTSHERRRQYLIDELLPGDIFVFSNRFGEEILSLVISVEKDIHSKKVRINELDVSSLVIDEVELKNTLVWDALKIVIRP
jgi:hypothetical protein